MYFHCAKDIHKNQHALCKYLHGCNIIPLMGVGCVASGWLQLIGFSVSIMYAYVIVTTLLLQVIASIESDTVSIVIVYSNTTQFEDF